MAEIVWEIIAPAMTSGDDGNGGRKGASLGLDRLEFRPLFLLSENLLIPVLKARSTSG
jgi:hypothetical protein